ncbi:MAG: aminotransferase class V-fold PLP-dependent enzyme [Clostridia bacterium]|nr:aminotransferase class V-fold PLP-dependent enzyme [Clostridia bacterium]
MIYFDNAATTWPKPASVVRAMDECMNEFAANPGRSAHSHAIKSSEKVYECREEIAEFFGIDNPGNVIFTSNATHSLNIVINGVLNEGDHVICTVMDHNSVLRTTFSKTKKIELSFSKANPDGSLNLTEFESLIKTNTKLVVMTHVSNVCGTVMPAKEVADICKKRNILFLLDASQSAGIVPINITEMGIDYLAAPGHKGLYGPMGTGILVINSKVIPKPLIFGGTGSYSKELSQPFELPDRLESGTLNVPGICGLLEGVRFIKAVGIQQISKHEKELTSWLLDGLEETKNISVVGKKNTVGRTGVVSFVHSSMDCTAVSAYLDSEFAIATRSMYHCAYPSHVALGTKDSGTVRVSFSLFNTIPQVKLLLYALSKI